MASETGSDLLSGGKGSDTFFFGQIAGGLEAVITDFTSNAAATGSADVLSLPVTGPGGAWIGSASFDASEVQARLDVPSGLVEVDTDGDGAADLLLDLVGISQPDQLTATDFIFD